MATGILLLALVLAVYGNGLFAPFTFDDVSNVQNNPELRQLWPPSAMANESRCVGYYSFALNYVAGARSAWPYRLTNLVIHGLSGWMFYLFLRTTLSRAEKTPQNSRDGFALAVAVLWLVHPLQTGSVTYVVQRFESLMGLFYLVALVALVRSADAQRVWPWQLVCIGACWLGLFTKEVMVTFIPAALLYDRAFLAASWREIASRRGWMYVACLLGVIALVAMSTVTYGAEANTTAGFHSQKISPWMYLRTQPEVILHYLRLVVWPAGQSLDYGWPVQDDLRISIPLGIIVLSLFLASVAFYVYRPRLGWWGVSFFLILGPTSSFLPIDDLAFEHRLYLPLAMLLTLLALAVVHLLRNISDTQRRHACGVALVTLMTVTWSACTIQRNWQYARDIPLWQSAALVNPNHPRLWNNLAGAYRKQGQLAASRECYERTLRLNPHDKYALGQLPFLLAELHEQQSDEAELSGAMELAQRLCEENPDAPRHRVTLIKLLTKLKKYDDAERECAQTASRLEQSAHDDSSPRKRPRWDVPTLEMSPLAETYYQWSLVRRDRNDPEGCLQLLAKAEQLAAADPSICFLQGVVLVGLGREAEAMTRYERAVKIDVSHEIAWNNLGVLLARRKDSRAAAQAYRTALYWRPEYPEALDNFGNLHARNGDYAKAISLYERAIATDREYEPAEKHLATARARLAGSQ